MNKPTQKATRILVRFYYAVDKVFDINQDHEVSGSEELEEAQKALYEDLLAIVFDKDDEGLILRTPDEIRTKLAQYFGQKEEE